MQPINATTLSALADRPDAVSGIAGVVARDANKPDAGAVQRRKLMGEFVGNSFYGVLMKQMNESKIKGKYFHGGRGEEAFRGQLAMELGKRMGQSPTDPIANKLFQSAEAIYTHKSKADAVAPNTDNLENRFPAHPQREFSTDSKAAPEFPAWPRMEYPA